MGTQDQVIPPAATFLTTWFPWVTCCSSFGTLITCCNVYLDVWAYWYNIHLPQTRSRDCSFPRLRPSFWSPAVPGRGTRWFAEWINEWRTKTCSDRCGGIDTITSTSWIPVIGEKHNKILAHTNFSLIKMDVGAPGWLSRLSGQLLIPTQIMISQSREFEPHMGSVLTVWSLLGILPLSLSLSASLPIALYLSLN